MPRVASHMHFSSYRPLPLRALLHAVVLCAVVLCAVVRTATADSFAELEPYGKGGACRGELGAQIKEYNEIHSSIVKLDECVTLRVPAFNLALAVHCSTHHNVS